MTQDIIKLSEIDFEQLKSDVVELSKELSMLNPFEWDDISRYDPPYKITIHPEGTSAFNGESGFFITIENGDFYGCYPLDMLLEIDKFAVETHNRYLTQKNTNDESDLIKEIQKRRDSEEFIKNIIKNDFEFAKKYIQSLETKDKE